MRHLYSGKGSMYKTGKRRLWRTGNWNSYDGCCLVLFSSSSMLFSCVICMLLYLQICITQGRRSQNMKRIEEEKHTTPPFPQFVFRFCFVLAVVLFSFSPKAPSLSITCNPEQLPQTRSVVVALPPTLLDPAQVTPAGPRHSTALARHQLAHAPVEPRRRQRQRREHRLPPRIRVGERRLLQALIEPRQHPEAPVAGGVHVAVLPERAGRRQLRAKLRQPRREAVLLRLQLPLGRRQVGGGGGQLRPRVDDEHGGKVARRLAAVAPPVHHLQHPVHHLVVREHEHRPRLHGHLAAPEHAVAHRLLQLARRQGEVRLRRAVPVANHLHPPLRRKLHAAALQALVHVVVVQHDCNDVLDVAVDVPQPRVAAALAVHVFALELHAGRRHHDALRLHHRLQPPSLEVQRGSLQLLAQHRKGQPEDRREDAVHHRGLGVRESTAHDRRHAALGHVPLRGRPPPLLHEQVGVDDVVVLRDEPVVRLLPEAREGAAHVRQPVRVPLLQREDVALVVRLHEAGGGRGGRPRGCEGEPLHDRVAQHLLGRPLDALCGVVLVVVVAVFVVVVVHVLEDALLRVG
eukprot:Rhum_TRINITY_DN16683_c0_g1::Rhum_TRINITY_DN16683_c0_g1_i1::g.164022::m.164022